MNLQEAIIYSTWKVKNENDDDGDDDNNNNNIMMRTIYHDKKL